MLELINVQKDYGRFKLNCSLEVKAGCVTGLIGQNVLVKVLLLKLFWV